MRRAPLLWRKGSIGQFLWPGKPFLPSLFQFCIRAKETMGGEGWRGWLFLLCRFHCKKNPSDGWRRLDWGQLAGKDPPRGPGKGKDAHVFVSHRVKTSIITNIWTALQFTRHCHIGRISSSQYHHLTWILRMKKPCVPHPETPVKWFLWDSSTCPSGCSSIQILADSWIPVSPTYIFPLGLFPHPVHYQTLILSLAVILPESFSSIYSSLFPSFHAPCSNSWLLLHSFLLFSLIIAYSHPSGSPLPTHLWPTNLFWCIDLQLLTPLWTEPGQLTLHLTNKDRPDTHTTARSCGHTNVKPGPQTFLYMYLLFPSHEFIFHL